MLEASPGYSFDEALTGPETRESGETYRGTHGYLPTNDEMRASLIILWRRRSRTGAKVRMARMIDRRPDHRRATQTEPCPKPKEGSRSRNCST